MTKQQRVERGLDAMRELHLATRLRIDDAQLEPRVGAVDHDEIGMTVDQPNELRIEAVRLVERIGRTQASADR